MTTEMQTQIKNFSSRIKPFVRPKTDASDLRYMQVKFFKNRVERIATNSYIAIRLIDFIGKDMPEFEYLQNIENGEMKTPERYPNASRLFDFPQLKEVKLLPNSATAYDIAKSEFKNNKLGLVKIEGTKLVFDSGLSLEFFDESPELETIISVKNLIPILNIIKEQPEDFYLHTQSGNYKPLKFVADGGLIEMLICPVRK